MNAATKETERPEVEDTNVSPTDRPTRPMPRTLAHSLVRDARGEPVPTPASIPADGEWAGFSEEMNAVFARIISEAPPPRSRIQLSSRKDVSDDEGS
jgi:hypothetical protein